MKFTFDAYRELVHQLREHNYSVCSYHDWMEEKKVVILRHDIDYDLNKARMLAETEYNLSVSSTYFVLLTSDFYNVFSSHAGRIINQIQQLGHEIGLHFDEVRYEGLDINAIKEKIIEECEVLSKITGIPVTTVSMHRPSKAVLEANLSIPGIINSYGTVFFKEFKYMSDSRRRWREPVEDIIASNQYNRLHILTHAFWYNSEELDLYDSILEFVNTANTDRYNVLYDNFTDLEKVMIRGEVR